MATFTVVNGRESDLVDVNAFGDDVAAMTFRTGVIMTNAELAALCALKGVAVTRNSSSRQIRRLFSIAATYLNGLA